MNRTKLQQLSEERVKDARALLAASGWPGAYYLAGYALECALKSCVLAHVERTGIIFEDRKFVENCWTHDLKALVKQADLVTEHNNEMAASTGFAVNWHIARDWSETTRYRLSTQQQAEDLLNAITDTADGVLLWVKKHW